MDESATLSKPRVNDLKDFYPCRKSLHNHQLLQSEKTNSSRSITSDFNYNSDSVDTVVTIDLSDDSLIEFDSLNDKILSSESIEENKKGACDDVDVINVDFTGKSTVTKISYQFSDSDDDSFDIPLSQRIGLTAKASSDVKAKDLTQECSSKAGGSDNNTKPVFSWPDDDSLETWTSRKDPIISSPKKSSPIKSSRNLINSDEAPFKKPTIINLKKLDKRPLQSDTQPIRKRRTPEEVQKLKQEKERRKVEKAEEKKARDKMKEKEKEKRAALREAGKTKLLADCQKFCKTFADVDMLEQFKIKDELQVIFKEKEAQLIIETNNPIDSGIYWIREEREIIEDETKDEATVNITRREVEADIILKVLHPSDYIPLVNHSISKIDLKSNDEEGSDGESSRTLFRYVTSILATYGKNLTLILFGFDKYSNQQKNRENTEYRVKLGLTQKRAVKNKDFLPVVRKRDIDLVLFDLQVRLAESPIYSSKRVHLIHTETPSDLCHIIWCHTKATAMFSIKKSQREQHGLEWYAQHDGYGSVDINNDGDITTLWIKQLQSFNKISEEMAKAVAEVYPCPQSLLSAYQKCTNETEKETLLNGIEVHRKNFNTGNTSKKLGTQVSRRIYLFMTSRDGDAIID